MLDSLVIAISQISNCHSFTIPRFDYEVIIYDEPYSDVIC